MLEKFDIHVSTPFVLLNYEVWVDNCMSIHLVNTDLNSQTQIEMNVNQAWHIYKSYYFFCDVLGSLAAKYCFDFQAARKAHRVYFLCFVIVSMCL